MSINANLIWLCLWKYDFNQYCFFVMIMLFLVSCFVFFHYICWLPLLYMLLHMVLQLELKTSCAIQYERMTLTQYKLMLHKIFNSQSQTEFSMVILNVMIIGHSRNVLPVSVSLLWLQRRNVFSLDIADKCVWKEPTSQGVFFVCVLFL